MAKRKPKTTHGGKREGAGRPPEVRFCARCGARCDGAVKALEHCR